MKKLGILVLLTVTLTFELSLAQQCTLPSRIFLPQPDSIRATGFGSQMDVDNGYMVVGVPYNDSLQVYSGIAYVYKVNNTNQWVEVARLAPSDPAKYREFGLKVSISGNSIAVFALEFDDAGNQMGKIYMFEKPTNGEWQSTTENYIIKNSISFAPNTFGDFELHANELIAVAIVNGQTVLQVHQKDAGVFALVQTITPPATIDYSSCDLTVGDTFFAIGNSSYENADHSNGAVFVYQKNGTYLTTPAKLTSTVQNNLVLQGFAEAITAYKSTLFVVGRILNSSTQDYDQTFYTFEQPSTGWVNSQQSAILTSRGSVLLYFQLAVNDNYIFIAGPGFKSVLGFKKPSTGWSSQAAPFVINDLPADKYWFGSQLSIDGNHLLAGCPGSFLRMGISQEFIADYYLPSGEWETPGLLANQIIRQIEKGATGDLFGISISANTNYLAVGAPQDSKQGLNAGAVYLFNNPTQSSVSEKIYHPQARNYEGFGQDVELGDSILFISAPSADSVGVDGNVLMYEIGKVYVYRLRASGWGYQTKIIAPNVKSSGLFGQNIVYFNHYVAITEFNTNTTESYGLVHIYKEDNLGKFDYIATLQPSIADRFNFFGRSVMMNDSLMVIATGNYGPNSNYRSKVYIFKKKGEWKSATEDAILAASDSGWSDLFGHSIAMDKDFIIVGAPNSPGLFLGPGVRNYIISGAVYIFKRPSFGWKGTILEIAKLTPSDPVEEGNFGYSVALDHNDLFIGSPQAINKYNYTDHLTNYDNSLRPGKVYHFKKPAGKDWVSSNQDLRQLMSFEPEIIDGYGQNILVSDRYLYVSAVFDDNVSGFRAGSVQTMMQLPVIDSIMPLCNTSPAVKLIGFPSRAGTWAGDGVNNSSKTFTPSIAGPGIHRINYSVAGCTDSTFVNVILDDFTILQESLPEQTKCIGQVIPLIFDSNEYASHYKWLYKDQPSSPYLPIDSLKKQININKPGYYEVKVSRTFCPARKGDFIINDEALIKITIDPIDVFCADHTQTINATPVAGTWTGSGISGNGVFDSFNLPDGIYKERYDFTTPVGCHYKDSVNVVIDRLKEPTLIFNNEMICGDRPVNLQLGNVDSRSSVQWLDGSNGPIDGQHAAIFPVFHPGTYSASVSKFSCVKQLPSVTVLVRPDSLFVPNVFTPNGDTHNDFFEIRSEGIDSFDLAVFNRYGSPVFQTSSTAFQWSGGDLSPGVYFWHVSYITCGQSRKEEKGWVQIIK